VDHAAERRGARGPVPIDVVERAARVKTGLEAEAHALRQPAERAHGETRHGEEDRFGRERGKRLREALLLLPREARAIRPEERDGLRRLRELARDEGAGLVER